MSGATTSMISESCIASSLLLPQIPGLQQAASLLALGETFTAKQALEAGLLWKIVNADEVEKEEIEFNEQLLSNEARAAFTTSAKQRIRKAD